MKAEQFILNHTRNCSNIEYRQGVYAPNYQLWITPEQALKAVEMEREEIIEETVSWLENNLCCYIVAQDFGIEHERLEKDFKKYFEEQV